MILSSTSLRMFFFLLLAHFRLSEAPFSGEFPEPLVPWLLIDLIKEQFSADADSVLLLLGLSSFSAVFLELV